MDNIVYAVPNPFWLADTFVFREHEDPEIGTVYVKLNHKRKIEEIGIWIDKRMHNCHLQSIKEMKSCKQANKKQITILDSIGDEYWYHILNMHKRSYEIPK